MAQYEPRSGSVEPAVASAGSSFSFRSGDALLVIDMQKDFLPDGRLAVGGGDEIVPAINELIAGAQVAGAWIYASRDWHPLTHPSFQEEGGPWPVHCVQDTDGAAFADDLKLPASVPLISKGTRFDQDQTSAFDQTGLGERLRRDGVERVVVCGLALDVCVHDTATESCREDFPTCVITQASRAVDPDSQDEVLARLRKVGVELIQPGP